MARLLIICTVQAFAGVGVSVLLWDGQTSAVRLAGLLAAVCLAPLLLLAAVPSGYTIGALVALPALVIWLAAIVQPAVVRPKPVRWYGIGALGLAIAASLIQLHWVGNCHELTFVVPDGFKGTVSLVKDGASGIDLEATDYTLTVPPTEVSIRDDRFLFRCYSATVRSTSGVVLPFRNGGVQPGRPIAMPGGAERSSTDFDGTTHRWIVD